MKPKLFILVLLLFLTENLPLAAQGPTITTPTGRKPLPRADGSSVAPGPSITTPTASARENSNRSGVSPTSQPANPFLILNYPWHLNISVSVFWVGEKPTERNPTPNNASSWDRNWEQSYGGYDNPDPEARINYIPKAFVPQQNPFYIALPYNDVLTYNQHKPEAKSVIPWFKRVKPSPGKTSCKGRWIKIVQNKKVCYAQWEDCGPFFTDDYQYVFKNQKPKNTQNKNAGIDISPAVRDYMKIKSGSVVHWRFVDFAEVPKSGPWTLYGTNNPFLDPTQDPDYEAKKIYMKYLQSVRSGSNIQR